MYNAQYEEFDMIAAEFVEKLGEEIYAFQDWFYAQDKGYCHFEVNLHEVDELIAEYRASK